MIPYWSDERGRYGTGESYDCISLQELTIPESDMEIEPESVGIMEE